MPSFCGEALLDWVVAEAAQRRGQALRRSCGLAAVYGGSSQHHRTLTEPKYARHLTGGMIYLPELADTDLTAYRGLLIPERLHCRLLVKLATGEVFTGDSSTPSFPGLPIRRWNWPLGRHEMRFRCWLM